MISIQYIHQAYKRMLKGDVRYQFVIDIAALKYNGHWWKLRLR
jgi:hypothetical protein